MESIVHGKTTGVDVMTVVRGGFLHVKAAGVEQLQVDEPFVIILVDSGMRARTIDAVNLVRHKVEAGTGKQTIEQIASVSKKLADIVRQKDFVADSGFIQSIQTNHELLAQLGLSNEKLEAIVDCR